MSSLSHDDMAPDRSPRCAPCSLVESEHPVAHAGPPGDNVGETPEASMMLCSPLEHMLVSAVAEWRIGTELAITQLVVSALRHVEVHWTASSDDPFALAIAEWTDL